MRGKSEFSTGGRDAKLGLRAMKDRDNYFGGYTDTAEVPGETSGADLLVNIRLGGDRCDLELDVV